MKWEQPYIWDTCVSNAWSDFYYMIVSFLCYRLSIITNNPLTKEILHPVKCLTYKRKYMYKPSQLCSSSQLLPGMG